MAMFLAVLEDRTPSTVPESKQWMKGESLHPKETDDLTRITSIP